MESECPEIKVTIQEPIDNSTPTIIKRDSTNLNIITPASSVKKKSTNLNQASAESIKRESIN